ncbi:MAG: phosphoribosylanthranilate isomerase [Flavobacteriaceae bacterium]|nr:MAG: phosphoribosylanthranilate isomerase [Flavobacteriaceae bacterium]
MKYVDNIRLIADMKPDYMGFIFYKKSMRNFEGIMPELPKPVKKTGVFVNEGYTMVVSTVKKHLLEVIQLHGDEPVKYIQELKNHLSSKVEIIKVFGIKDDFDFEVLKPYENEVDYFLFDTKGKERGGNGVKFDWNVLKNYPFSTPFFLSGGIEPGDVEEIIKIKASGLPVYAVDINSRFETKPGLKNIKEVRKFKNKLIASGVC